MVNVKEIDRKIRILIAEDEENIGDLLVELLESPDREIVLARNGREAMDHLEKASYDLLITDLMMPEVDGMEVLTVARRLYPEIMVIIITGYASLETAIQAVKQGAYDYLRKPFRLEELKISVENACEKIILKRENAALLQKISGGLPEKDGDQPVLKPAPFAIDSERVKEDENGEKGLAGDSIIGPDWVHPDYFKSDRPDARMVLDELERLGNLLNQGLITQEEFALLKKKLFNRI